jgi:hypothetical protein
MLVFFMQASAVLIYSRLPNNMLINSINTIAGHLQIGYFKWLLYKYDCLFILGFLVKTVSNFKDSIAL